MPVTQSTEAIPDMLHGTIAMVGGANYVSFFEAQAKGTVQFKVTSSVAIILDIGAGYITGRINGAGLGAFITDYSSGAGNLPVILAATLWAGLAPGSCGRPGITARSSRRRRRSWPGCATSGSPARRRTSS